MRSLSKARGFIIWKPGRAAVKPCCCFTGHASAHKPGWNWGTIERLSKEGYHVVAMNLPGYDESQRSGIPREEFLARALAQLPGNKPVIVSPSMSGQFSLPLLARHPQAVAGYVPVAPVGIKAHAAELSKVEVPTLVMWGENDRVIPPEQADLLSSALRGSHKLILPDSSHPCYLDRPEEFHEGLLRFLRSLPGN